MTRSERFAELNNLAENRRLHKALMSKFNAWRVNRVFFSCWLSSF
jgi:hypothetical protein